MPARFMEVVPNLLYRGSAPKGWEIPVLKKQFGVEQIISLDKHMADDIYEDCKTNGIEQKIIPINTSNSSDDALLLIKAGVSNIIGNKTSFVHCIHGKDRTGLFIAKYRVENGWNCKDALDEAIYFGFGIGMDKNVVKTYIDIITSSCKENHDHVDINYYFKEIKHASICNECGMIKKGSCNNCFIVNALIKNANILLSSVDEERESLEEKNMQKDDENIGGGSEVSTLFNVPEAIAMTTKQRQLYIKALCKQANKISFIIPEEEKVKAKECVVKLEEFVDEILLKVKVKEDFVDILDIIYNPFNENQGITSEQAEKIKTHIKIFIEILANNMIQVQKYAIYALDILEKFNSDADVAAMNKSFFDSIDTLTQEEANFEIILENTKNKDFQQDILNAIKTLKKSSGQVKQLVNERIIPYLRKDVLGEDWTTEIKQDLKKDVEEQQK